MIDPKEVMADIEWLRLNQPNNRKTWNVCEGAERWVIDQYKVGPTIVPPTCPICAKKNKLKAASQKKRRARIAKEKAGI